MQQGCVPTHLVSRVHVFTVGTSHMCAVVLTARQNVREVKEMNLRKVCCLACPCSTTCFNIHTSPKVSTSFGVG